jgi:hypothetical protein
MHREPSQRSHSLLIQGYDCPEKVSTSFDVKKIGHFFEGGWAIEFVHGINGQRQQYIDHLTRYPALR